MKKTKMVAARKDDGRVELDYDSESGLVRSIREHLLTSSQVERLHGMQLSIEDVLNGRFGTREESDVKTILSEWNQTLGRHEFGF